MNYHTINRFSLGVNVLCVLGALLSGSMSIAGCFFFSAVVDIIRLTAEGPQDDDKYDPWNVE